MTEKKQPVIIQSGACRTGSTILVNLLYGFIIPNEHIRMFEYVDHLPIFSQYSIVKTHLLCIDEIIELYGDKYDLYFVFSEREGASVPSPNKLCNKLYISYNEILESDTNSISNIVNTLYNKLRDFLPSDIPLSKETALKRIIEMNAEYERIKDYDFHGHINTFYQLHGSHRNPEITKNWPR